ncbi:LPXTG cell wall anchor domain-containing protein [Saccharothrix xinjiangensis]|uniref:LPXTG cell wall anchor domain-containing protein n=1 Tax=Saccharothrix xinjiangensis TaxID=204798 RepID=A0ABV9YBG6_9PSEU
MKLARAGAFLGALTATFATSAILATPASAHNWKVTPDCKDGQASVQVQLIHYAPESRDKANRIKVTVNGETIADKDFGANLDEKFTAPADVEREFVVKVTAHDGNQHSFTQKKTVQPCPVQPPAEQPPAEQPPAEEPPAEQPPAEEPPAEQPPAEQPPAESSVPVSPTASVAPTSVVPIAAEETPLANTGASIAIPLVIGVVLLGGGAALLIMQRKRAARD